MCPCLIVSALDSPLIYGSDIGKAKRILFNIYSSQEHPIIVRELQEIDDFFDQLDPNIDVIWGTATDDTLGEDAKVTILATGLEDDLRTEVEKDAHRDEDDFYEDLIPKLYKPVKKEKPTIKEAIVQELPFEVEEAPAPEPVTEKQVSETETVETQDAETMTGSTTDSDTEKEEPKQPAMLDKWKKWLNDLMKDVTE